MRLSQKRLAAVLLALMALDLLLATYAMFRGPFPIKVTLGTPLAYRNIYLHVPIAVSTYVVLGGALVSSLAYLRTREERYSRLADAFVKVGLLYGAATLLTGSAWASESWGTPWNWDPKQTAVLMLFLAYLLYFPLKKSITDPERSRQIAASYAVAAFALVPLSFMASIVFESLHPTPQAIAEFSGGGSGGALLGPRILLLMALGVLLSVALARGGLRLPRLLPLGILLFGVAAALVFAHPLVEGEYYRVVSAEVDEQGRITSLELSQLGRVDLEAPVESPVWPPVTSEGESSLVGHLVRLEEERIVILPHWSTPYTFVLYTLMLSLALYLNIREAQRRQES